MIEGRLTPEEQEMLRIQQLQQSVQNSSYLPAQQKQGGYGDNIVAVMELENTKLIKRIKLLLSGGALEEDGEKKGEPYLSEEGVKDLINFLNSHLDKNTIMGHLRSETFDHLAKELRHDLVDWIRFKGKKYGVDKEKRTLILDMVFNPILFALTRAEGGDEKSYRSGILSLGQQLVERPQQKGFIKGLFSRN